MQQNAPRRGEIYWVDWEPARGSEQRGTRPSLIVQNDLGNRSAPSTIIAAMTTRIPDQDYPFLVVVEPAESAPHLNTKVSLPSGIQVLGIEDWARRFAAVAA